MTYYGGTSFTMAHVTDKNSVDILATQFPIVRVILNFNIKVYINI
jgi:hypothetical protein